MYTSETLPPRFNIRAQGNDLTDKSLVFLLATLAVSPLFIYSCRINKSANNLRSMLTANNTFLPGISVIQTLHTCMLCPFRNVFFLKTLTSRRICLTRLGMYDNEALAPRSKTLRAQGKNFLSKLTFTFCPCNY